MTVLTLDDVVLHLAGVRHSFGPTHVLDATDLLVRRGEFLAVVGASGCGKTTLLNLCSGWLTPSAGTVRRCGRARTVFQSSGLFPWMTVEQNVGIALGHLGEAERRRRVEQLIARTGLEPFARHYPHQISPGMRQRIELVRTFATEAELLLLDEPFSSLDYLTRLQMRRELAGLLSEQPRTVVLVTHDVAEAAQLADAVVVLAGRPSSVRETITLPPRRRCDVTDPSITWAVRHILSVLGHGGDQPRNAHGARVEGGRLQ
jgi:NitT/TauT family transport system ATP-binding protein